MSNKKITRLAYRNEHGLTEHCGEGMNITEIGDGTHELRRFMIDNGTGVTRIVYEASVLFVEYKEDDNNKK